MPQNRNKYIVELSEIKTKKQDGDMRDAAKVVGITHANARQALMREDSKHHATLIIALTRIITMREALIDQGVSS